MIPLTDAVLKGCTIGYLYSYNSVVEYAVKRTKQVVIHDNETRERLLKKYCAEHARVSREIDLRLEQVPASAIMASIENGLSIQIN